MAARWRVTAATSFTGFCDDVMEVDIGVLPLMAGYRLLLCSNGVPGDSRYLCAILRRARVRMQSRASCTMGSSADADALALVPQTAVDAGEAMTPGRWRNSSGGP